MRAHPERLVFIDETSVKTNLTRLRGRSLCGKRLEMDAPFGAWGTQTFIAGLTQDELIAPWIIKGAMDGGAFTTRPQRQPYAKPGAGFYICRHTHLISILSKWLSRNSKHTCEGSGPEHSTRCLKHSPIFATSSRLTNAGISFAKPGMDQVKSSTL